MGPNFSKKHQQNQSSSSSSKGGSVGIPKGCLPIKVGQTIEEQEKFIIPIVYFNHPLFTKLLKDAEDEFGFEQKGTITIPCHVEEFLYIEGLIDQENHHRQHHHHGQHGHGHRHHHHNRIVGCFRA